MGARTAKSCGPDASTPVLTRDNASHCAGTVAIKPITGESTKQAVTPLRRECRMMRRTCGDYACVLFYLHTRLRVQPRTRHSLRSLYRRVWFLNLGRLRAAR